MNAYKVTLNGKVYEFTIEKINKEDIKPAEAPKTAATPAAPAAPVAGNGEKVVSPMPGTILSVNVTAGQAVKKGDVLFILEAMKMENEIMAPADGTIAAVSTTKGASVEAGALLCTFA